MEDTKEVELDGKSYATLVRLAADEGKTPEQLLTELVEREHGAASSSRKPVVTSHAAEAERSRGHGDPGLPDRRGNARSYGDGTGVAAVPKSNAGSRL